MLQACFLPDWSFLAVVVYPPSSCFKTVLCIHARAGQPARCSLGVGLGPRGVRPRWDFARQYHRGLQPGEGKSKKSQRGAFRISGLSFGASVDRQVGPLAAGQEGKVPQAGVLGPATT